MPTNITQLPTTSSITSATTFIVVNNGTTRRYSYQDLSDKIIPNGAVGFTGSAGLNGSVGYTGSAGLDGSVGYTGSAGIGVPTGGTTGQALVKASSTDHDTTWSTISGAYSRTTTINATQNIYPNDTANISFTGFKSYALLKVGTSVAAWVRLYTTSAARSSDSARAQTTDPTPGSGVIAEVITSATQTVLMTPGVFGFNDDATPSTTIYAAVTNLTAGQQAVTVTLTLLQLEA